MSAPTVCQNRWCWTRSWAGVGRRCADGSRPPPSPSRYARSLRRVVACRQVRPRHLQLIVDARSRPKTVVGLSKQRLTRHPQAPHIRWRGATNLRLPRAPDVIAPNREDPKTRIRLIVGAICGAQWPSTRAAVRQHLLGCVAHRRGGHQLGGPWGREPVGARPGGCLADWELVAASAHVPRSLSSGGSVRLPSSISFISLPECRDGALKPQRYNHGCGQVCCTLIAKTRFLSTGHIRNAAAHRWLPPHRT